LSTTSPTRGKSAPISHSIFIRPHHAEMTDSNGFYRPQDLPQDVPDPIPLSDDEDDDAKRSYTESESGSSVTYLNSPTIRTRASSSAASYIFPDMRNGRRSPVSMSDYGSAYPGYPRLSMDYTPQRSEYTPSASVFTPQTASNYSPPVSLYSPTGSNSPPSTTNYTPLLPAMAERRYGYGTAPELPLHISEPSQPKKRRRGCFCARGLFLILILLPLLLWKLGAFSAIYYEVKLSHIPLEYITAVVNGHSFPPGVPILETHSQLKAPTRFFQTPPSPSSKMRAT
jgi:hypothetical protein